MDKESIPVPRYYPHTFEFRANITRQDINAENCESVYKYLIDNI